MSGALWERGFTRVIGVALALGSANGLLACDGLQQPLVSEEVATDGAEVDPAIGVTWHSRSDSPATTRPHQDVEVEPADDSHADDSHTDDAHTDDAHTDDPATADPVPSAADAQKLLPAYFEFIRALKARGFVFMDFDGFWRADKAQLPSKLLVVRHDVHQRDVAAAYAMRGVERALLAERVATYFVMLGFPPELAKSDVQQQYLDLISRLKADGVDVQPHISANDLYVSEYQPGWAQKSLKQLERMTAGDYTIQQYDDGVEITSVPNDPLDIGEMDVRFVDLLTRYNERWSSATGLAVESYASHGSHLPLNLVLNNATMLDQRELIAAGVYAFDTYNTRVMRTLEYLSDNEQPSWMDHPEVVADGRYQLLAHPRSWTPSLTAQRLAAEAAAAEAGGGAGGAGNASQ